VSNTPGLISSISLSATVRPAAHVLGIRAGGWHAIVNERGSIRMDEEVETLDWYVAADDRWHNPAKEPSVRQTRRAGVPVVETRLRIPSGDAVQRVYAVADHGGLLVIEISNESTLPIAVAFTRSDILSSRQPSPLGPQGIDLPPGSVVFPVAHGSTLRVALASSRATGGTVNLEQLPSGEQLQRGWLNSVERAGYAIVADKSLSPLINRLRSDALVLSGREGGASVLRYGVPRMWLGVNMECHRVAASPEHTVSYGMRWHGEKPAVLWETSGPFGLRLDAGATDESWHSVEATGDALLAGFVAQ